MIKVFFDASVIISVLLSPNGGSGKLIQFAKQEAIAGITSQTVIDEIENNSVKISKSIGEIRQFIKDNSIIIRERITPVEINTYESLVDKKDAHVVAGAKLTKCEYLVTLDKKHLLKEASKRSITPIEIVNPKGLLEKLVK